MLNPDTRRSASAIWVAVLALFAILNLGRLTLSSVGHDFYQFWSIGLFADPTHDTYAHSTARLVSDHARRRVSVGKNASARGQRASEIDRLLYPNGIDPISTPAYYASFSAAFRGNYDVDLLAFQFLTTLLFGVAGWQLMRSLGYSRIGASTALAILVLIFGPLHADIEAGNSARLQLALLAATLALHHRGSNRAWPLTAGLLLGATVAWKPNLAAIPLVWSAVWACDRRIGEWAWAAAGWALGAGLAIGAGSARFGWSAWRDWISALSVYQSQPAPIAQGNWGTARLLFEWTGVDASLGLAALALAALGACAWRRRGSSHSRLERDLIATGAALLLPLLASQIVWDHYFLFALPAICVVLRPGPVSGARALAGGVALLGSAVTPLRILWPSVEPIGIAITLMLSTATLFGLLLWDLAGRKPEGTA